MQRHTPTHFEKKRHGKPYMCWEIREFKRLLWALLLFLTVFLGKKIYPDRMLEVGEQVVAVLGSSTDFSGVFSRLGDSMNESEALLKGFEEFCVEVFGVYEETHVEQTSYPEPMLPESPVGLLSGETDIYRILYASFPPEEEREPESAIPAVGTVLSVGQPQKQELPEGYTMDELSFGELETVSPLAGTLTSGYGYREHPVNGKHCFHGGVDIGADAGTAIVSFANGRVEYVGKDNSYGLYFQIDHGNGIKSFYAHCQEVCVGKGQQVLAGEKVALVGATGTATGPHLHLELKCADVRVDPSYYLTLHPVA